MPGFLEAFFPLAAARFGAPGEIRRVSQAMADAARLMFSSRNAGRTLDRVFLEAFAPAVGLPTEEARARFAAFYREDFERMRRLVRPVPAARPLLRRARALGYELVLATNPVFFLDAILARVRWAQLEDVPFAFVTGAELMWAAKPRKEYYAHVLRLAGRRAEECLMIGNDARMDMAAKNVGIATWLAVPSGEEAPPEPVPLADRTGTLEQLEAWLVALGRAG